MDRLDIEFRTKRLWFRSYEKGSRNVDSKSRPHGEICYDRSKRRPRTDDFKCRYRLTQKPNELGFRHAEV